MNYKKILLSIIYALWIGFITAQQIFWIIEDRYNFLAFVWYLIMLVFPYLIYKYWE